MASSGARSCKTSIEDTSTKHRVLKLANDLLKMCHNEANMNNNSKTSSQHIPKSISSIDQLKSNIYVFIYETLCNTELVDKKWPAKTLEEEVHNVQAVIDSLSMDILHEDLSHLTGEGICGGVYSKKRRSSGKEESQAYFEPDLVSVEYLLEILGCIHDWVSSRLESSTEISSSCPSSFTQNEKKQNSNYLNKNEFESSINHLSQIDIEKFAENLCTKKYEQKIVHNKNVDLKNTKMVQSWNEEGELVYLFDNQKNEKVLTFLLVPFDLRFKAPRKCKTNKTLSFRTSFKRIIIEIELNLIDSKYLNMVLS